MCITAVMAGFMMMKQFVSLVLVAVASTIDVCIDYSSNDFCTKYMPTYCSSYGKYCRVVCGLCTLPPPTPAGISLQVDCLSVFNAKRSLHQNTPDLVWDGTAEAQAQAVVDAIPVGGAFSFGSNNYYGTMGFTYLSSARKSHQSICQSAVDKWYQQSNNYDYSNPGNGGSFTQLIWKSSTQLGVGISIKQKDGWYHAYVIAFFYVAGNNGDYLNNVMPLKNVLPTTTTTTTTPPPTTTTTASKPEISPSSITGGEKDDCLSIHNEKRALHTGTKPLIYNLTIEASAQAYAEKLAAEIHELKHEDNIAYGENLYLSSNIGMTNGEACIGATNKWYDEIKDYDYNNPGFSMATGHFTQVVWKSTTQLGVGIARNENRVYVVARYDPPGNVRGQFQENVA